MILFANRIYLSDELTEVFHNSPTDFSNYSCIFTYFNVKTGRESSFDTTVQDALVLAESRREDKRYKNFEFFIS